MRPTLVIAAALGLSVTGCDFIAGLTGGGSPPAPSVTAVPVPIPAGSPVAGKPSPPFGQPTVAQKEPPQGILPPDLISSTDPDQRIQQVKKNTRNDPFALLPTIPSVQLPPGMTLPGISPGSVSPGSVSSGSPGSVSPGSPGSGSIGGAGGGAGSKPPSRPASGSPNRAGSPGSAVQGGGSRGSASGANGAGGGASGGQGTGSKKPAPRSPIAVPVPRPDPTLAKAVQVTGVVQIGNQAFAIVNAPNEPTSRYVQEGQRLSGGQVLVRRIDFNRAEPVVILEQSGVEVVRAVGDSGSIASPVPGAPTT